MILKNTVTYVFTILLFAALLGACADPEPSVTDADGDDPEPPADGDSEDGDGQEGDGDEPDPSLFIDWARLKNPILSVSDRMLKDQAVVYRDGWFYMFASTRFADDDPEADSKCRDAYKSRNLRDWEPFCAAEAGYQGSPDIIHADGRYVMIQQQPPQPEDDWMRRLYYTTSPDLETWSETRPVLAEVFPGTRIIDGALAYMDNRYLIGFKDQLQLFHVTLSLEDSLEGGWEHPKLVGFDAVLEWTENYQFLEIDGSWRLIATGRAPLEQEKPDGFPVECATSSYVGNHEPFIFVQKHPGNSQDSFALWTGKTHLEVPYEDWNIAMRANSAYLCDWREHDGYFYLFYAGSNDCTSFQGRGHGKIGVARSPDLLHWETPGGGSVSGSR